MNKIQVDNWLNLRALFESSRFIVLSSLSSAEAQLELTSAPGDRNPGQLADEDDRSGVRSRFARRRGWVIVMGSISIEPIQPQSYVEG